MNLKKVKIIKIKMCKWNVKNNSSWNVFTKFVLIK